MVLKPLPMLREAVRINAAHAGGDAVLRWVQGSVDALPEL